MPSLPPIQLLVKKEIADMNQCFSNLINLKMSTDCFMDSFERVFTLSTENRNGSGFLE